MTFGSACASFKRFDQTLMANTATRYLFDFAMTVDSRVYIYRKLVRLRKMLCKNKSLNYLSKVKTEGFYSTRYILLIKTTKQFVKILEKMFAKRGKIFLRLYSAVLNRVIEHTLQPIKNVLS